jgi:predicted alpha/beta hydrolase
VSVETTFPARDGYPLAGTLFRPERPDSSRVLLIGSAMGVRRRFYARFAGFFARHGFTVLTFDYRGTGGSVSPHDRSDTALHDWGEQDLSGAIEWLRETRDAPRVGVVAHSVSAQLLGLVDSNDRLGPLVLVAPQSGYWRLFGRYALAVAGAWYVGIPVAVALFGRLPGWALGGLDVPAGVAREWARWGRHPDYILSYRADMRQRFGRIASPLLIYSMSDDVFAPPDAVAEIASWYAGCHGERRVLKPEPDRSIGHFDFFKERVVDDAWREAVEWMSRQGAAAAREPGLD